jgi:hypothetical protein
LARRADECALPVPAIEDLALSGPVPVPVLVGVLEALRRNDSDHTGAAKRRARSAAAAGLLRELSTRHSDSFLGGLPVTLSELTRAVDELTRFGIRPPLGPANLAVLRATVTLKGGTVDTAAPSTLADAVLSVAARNYLQGPVEAAAAKRPAATAPIRSRLDYVWSGILHGQVDPSDRALLRSEAGSSSERLTVAAARIQLERALGGDGCGEVQSIAELTPAWEIDAIRGHDALMVWALVVAGAAQQCGADFGERLAEAADASAERMPSSQVRLWLRHVAKCILRGTSLPPTVEDDLGEALQTSGELSVGSAAAADLMLRQAQSNGTCTDIVAFLGAPRRGMTALSGQ